MEIYIRHLQDFHLSAVKFRCVYRVFFRMESVRGKFWGQKEDPHLNHHLQQPLGYWKVLSHPKKYIQLFISCWYMSTTWEVNERGKRVEILWWSLTWWRYDRPDLHQKFNQMLEVKDAPEIITCKFTHIESLTLPAFQKLFNHKSAHSPQPMTVIMTRYWWPFAILVWVFHGILLPATCACVWYAKAIGVRCTS